MFRLLLAFVALASAAFVWWSGQMLPAQVASRFDSQGVVVSWMSRETFIGLMLLLASVMPTVTALLQMRNSRLSRTRIPNPEHWYAEPRRNATVAYLEAHAAVFATALSVFMCFVFWRVVAAHLGSPQAPVLDKQLFLLGLGVFVAFAVGWTVLRHQHFRRIA
ncbi:DUF1648 domain-containing protein [Rubrivivax rivuli]|uniref:DUF1648 domain-containing protein n=1 Tax=Rubrivivax rivuli TaxID=1862385 RepID=A0A437RFQ2_9BURK|nr:DUF1648 domain-containing protein [Rubrivivax rivuli]RVU45601.1 DUF1648 domain-containing protein [Rubrivivax rivuli]